jgi:hypothetical protein
VLDEVSEVLMLSVVAGFDDISESFLVIFC